MENEAQGKSRMKKLLLILNCILLSIGNCGGPLIMRLYFVHGGKRIWLSCWLETVGWPIMLIPISIAYYRRQRRRQTNGPAQTKFFLMKPSLFISSALIGLLSGLDNYIFANGVARLPVSTSALIITSQLAFTAGFAFLLVRQKFTGYSVNAIVLLTIGGAVLSLNTSGDRPQGESNKEYIKGFLMMVGTSALYGFILPLVELTYKKAKQTITYSLVLEFQMVMCLFATIFCTAGMLINEDFQAIPREAENYGIRETKYYLVLVWSVIIWQAFFLGAIGVIFCVSSLQSGILIAVLLPITEILAVILYKESFKAEKGVSLLLSLWGFVSYFYGEMEQTKKTTQQTPETEITQTLDP